MKQSPDLELIQSKMISSSISRNGFLGSDIRKLIDIISEDMSILTSLNTNQSQIATRMEYITNEAAKSFGTSIIIEEKWEAMVDDSRGKIPCPFSHNSFSYKRITYVKNIITKTNLFWSDLNIHLINEHCFFQGKGTTFRIEPLAIYNLLFG